MPSLKTVIEENPFRAVAAAAAAMTTVAISCLTWFYMQSASLKDKVHESAMSTVRSELNEQVSDLKRRLLSIERRVQGERLYIDISKIPISATEMPLLSADYKSFGSATFFVSPPAFAAWAPKPQASQLDLIKLILGERVGEAVGSSALGALVSERSGTLWTGTEVVEVPVPDSSSLKGMVSTLRISPFIFAMYVDDAYIRRTMSAVASVLGIEARPTTDRQQFAIEAISNSAATSDIDVGIDHRAAISKTQALIDQFAEFASDDLATLMLTDALASRTQLALILQATLRVVAAEKKGNVFYVRTHMQFRGPTAKDPLGDRMVLDEEVFFIGTGRGGVLVRIGIPSQNLRSDAYAWTQAWLVSLRVPIK
jgi:hypothetical protein